MVYIGVGLIYGIMVKLLKFKMVLHTQMEEVTCHYLTLLSLILLQALLMLY